MLLSLILFVSFYLGLLALYSYHDSKLNGLLSDSIGKWKYLLILVAVAVYPLTIIGIVVLFFYKTKKFYAVIQPTLVRIVKKKLNKTS